ncbi:GNAT family N-acetyltransferase [Peribacillus sp. SCS-26]|uniref:GNAT family N-acetyltransferase n=1 Tax=Paraperibacillus marinus TaxID=3115295 RepID=UPI0039065B4D
MNYKDQEGLRKSFNELALSTFGISFENWYQKGYWGGKYIPYSFEADGRIVSNISVNISKLCINGEQKRAVQIGTVMTHPGFRGRGLSRKLMEKVMADFNTYELFYLFANSSVLGYYPKFGFLPVEETLFHMDCPAAVGGKGELRKLNGANPYDLDFIYRKALNRIPVSECFGTLDTAEILMYHCMNGFSGDLYYAAEVDALVIARHEGDCLHLFDVISGRNVPLSFILPLLAAIETKTVIFHYTPDLKENPMEGRKFCGSEVLLVKNLSGTAMPPAFKHPITSQA